MADGTAPRPGWWARRSVRARLTLLATSLVTLGLVAGSALLLAALQRSLLGAVDEAARQGARDVAGLVDSRQLPEPVPVAGGIVVQVIDRDGRVVASSPGGDRLVPLLEGADLAAVRAGGARELAASRIGLTGTLRVVAEPAGGENEPQTVLVATPLTATARSLHVVEVALAIGVPLLVLAFAAACWLVVGSALRPVAELRAGAEEITGARTARRLPVPPARDEVGELARTLNDMLDRLEAASARQRAFVADAAHELRSPLAAIRTQVEVARAHPESAEWDATSEAVLEDVARLTRLVDDLLLLARVDDEAVSARVRRAPVDLSDLVGSVVARGTYPVPVRLRPTAEHGRGDASVIHGDGDALVRVIGNLLDNAARHARTEVVVDLGRDAGPHAGNEPMVSVTITDDGPGIPEAERDRVFDRFARLDGSRSRDAGGSGLGLAIVRRLVLLHGGSVVLEDADPGLRAVVRLPTDAGRG